MQVAWSEFISAFRNIVRQYRRSLFGISAVAFGVIALLLAAGFVEWIFWASREGTIQAGLGHIHIIRPGYLEDGQADPNRFLMPDNSAQLSAIEALPAVRTVAPRVAFTGLISRGETTLSFMGEGDKHAPSSWATEGRPGIHRRAQRSVMDPEAAPLHGLSRMTASLIRAS